MRFLIVLAATLAYASAGVLAPLAYAVNPGDAQAAAIDSHVAAQDHARAAAESHGAAVEQAVHHNAEALRQAADGARNLHENAYWASYDAARTHESAVSGQAAAIDGLARSVVPQPLAYGHAGVYAAPYAAAPYAAAPYAALPYAPAPYAALPYAGYGHAAPLVHHW